MNGRHALGAAFGGLLCLTAQVALAQAQMELAITLPSRDPAGLESFLSAQQNPSSPQYHRWLTPQAFADRFGAHPAVVAQVQAALSRAGFASQQDTAHTLSVKGTMERVSGLLGVGVTVLPGSMRPAVTGRASLPDELRALGATVTVYDGVERMHPHGRSTGHVTIDNRYQAAGTYWFTDLKEAYDAPSYLSLNGTGRTIAVLMSGDVKDTDTAAYFKHEAITTPPTVTRVEVNGGAKFSATAGGSFEASLDVQQSSGMAPKATILLYLIPSLSDSDIQAGLRRIVADNKADVVSMSFGGCEKIYTAAYNNGRDYTSAITALEPIFKQGNAQGMTFIASSGDNGALQCPSTSYLAGKSGSAWVAGASTPATSPEVTAVGGTNLVTVTGQGLDSAYVSENANGDPLKPSDPYGLKATMVGGYWGSGGGPSVVFAKPTWQNLVATGTTQRATPDLALTMGGCPSDAYTPCGPNRSAVIVQFNGQTDGAIGTSASAPGFAGVVALMVQKKGARLGNLNPTIYQDAATQAAGGLKVFRQKITGYNGAFYSGTTAYNMVLGNGTVDIRPFIGAQALPAAGTPQTASNP